MTSAAMEHTRSLNGGAWVEESALVIPVTLPKALDWIRSQFDPMAQVLPVHVSLLIPFANRALDDTVDRQLKRLTQTFSPLVLEARGVGFFSGEELDTVYLAIADNVHFDGILSTVCAEFPQYPPYGGRHPDIIPHVTLARVPSHEVQQVHKMAQIALNGLGGTITMAASALAWITRTSPMADPQNWLANIYPLGSARDRR